MDSRMKIIELGNFKIGAKQPLVLISGPCVIESEDHAMESALALKEIADALNIPFIYKSSYDKANRSSKNSFRGPGITKGLEILNRVKQELNVPVITDVHSPEEAREAAQVCDIIQIPAFLCRQTDLVIACAETGRIVNVKKGQFMAPWDMKNVVEKITSCGNHNIILTDRGTTFGYNNLVVDMRSMPIMSKLGYPVCFDASHAVQLPGGRGDRSGGDREYIPHLAKAAVAAGADVLFIESHLNPEAALSDKDTVFPVKELKKLLKTLQDIRKITLCD
jgi:2-dehydro-3-deoxyphosphooctonate aldolase (KDO 8-P synthase)